jgi:SAM-dependent methyltransferase
MLTDSAIAYETHAQEFLQGRDASTIGSVVVERWARALPIGSEVIELGCGAGYPITRVLHATGLRLWAIDSSISLVKEFKQRFPAIPVQCEKVQSSNFFNRTYHAAIAVGLLFLLPENDQLALIERVARILEPGGRFLFTAPIEIGEWNDLNTGIVCHSLGRIRYESCLNAAGFRIVSTFSDKGENNYYDVERTS